MSHRILALLLIMATIASVSTFAIFTVNSQVASTKQLSINCSNPCLITITAQGFGGTAVIARGSSVLWRNMDSISHSLSAAGNWSFDTGIIQPGQTSKSVPFSSDGTFDYYCKVSMAYGEITVIG